MAPTSVVVIDTVTARYPDRALASGQRIILPSEAEWEAAAGNSHGDLHPWGDTADPRRANIRATGIGAVVAPGRFSPEGDNQAGRQELIGNVWEWTRSLWGYSGNHPTFGYPYRHDDRRETASTRPGARYVIRGGVFYYATECANSFTRNRMLATDRAGSEWRRTTPGRQCRKRPDALG
ncbi:formylglycine-generating enzyme family protein [Micromonospora globosa]|uniref:formylglycine-generating enzyme family protein n=1 Tax=Micromonospora globosa TaxID=47863 RepID=UPI001E4F7832|nr:SUMF1/EgtB/PvdO family nonheme iron enzyme [Micromonospora globosa]